MKNNPAQKYSAAESALIFGIVVLSFFFWNTFIVFPIKVFVVFLHETSHSITILLTGGKVSEISLGFDLGGKIVAEGGNDIAIASSGYLGSLLFGLLILITTELHKVRRNIFLVLAFLFFLITILSSPTLEFVLIGLITIGMFVFFAFYIRIRLVKIVAKVLALVSAIYVLIDLKEDMLSNNFSSDAQILAGLTGIDQLVISLIWIVLSVLAIWLVIKYSFSKRGSS